MSRADDYEYWNHTSGHRLNANGKRIMYTNDAIGLTLFVEADLDESLDESEMEYRVWLQNEENDNVIHPEPFPTKDAAFERLEELMEEYDHDGTGYGRGGYGDV